MVAFMVGVVPLRVKLQETCTTRISFQDTSIFWRKCIEIGKSRFVSQSSSHTLCNVHCITYSEQRQQSIVMSGGCLEEAENNKKF